MHKVVLVGPRGAATRVLEHRPREWSAEGWTRADGQGEVGEPVMDWASFNEPFHVNGAPHRAFFFGYGIDREDFERLGPQTKAAMFKRIDHLVLVLSGAARGVAEVVGDDLDDPAVAITAIGLDGFSARSVDVGGRAVPVAPLAVADIPGWMRGLVSRLAGEAPPAGPRGSSAAIASIVSANLERAQLTKLTEPWEILLSPIWEPGPTGSAVRRAFLAPSSMRAHYFEGAARDILCSPEIGAAVAAMAQREDARHPIADLRDLYCAPDAPFVEVAKAWTPELGALSLLLADAARCARVGATIPQLLAHGLAPEQSAALGRIEDDYRAKVIDAPVDALVHAMAELTQPGGGARRRPWWKLW